MSWNTGAWNGLEYNNSHLDQMCYGIIEEKIDLAGFGEIVHVYGGPGNAVDNWVDYIISCLAANNYPMHAAYFPQDFTYKNTTGGLLMLSKFPILDYSEVSIGAETVENFVVQTTVQPIPGHDLHFFQSHLFSSLDIPEKAVKIGAMLNYMNQFPGPKVVVGDMNFSPQTEPTNHQMFMNDGWIDSGLGFVGQELFTVDSCCHRPPGALLQIDYVFLKEGYGYSDSYVPYDNPNLAVSDHWPVIATINFQESEG